MLEFVSARVLSSVRQAYRQSTPPYRSGRPRRMEREAMSKASQEAAREWTRVHDRSGATDLPRDCPRSASVRLCSKNLIYPIAVAAGNGHVGETCGSVFASAVTEESGIFENIADGFGQCFGIVGGT